MNRASAVAALSAILVGIGAVAAVAVQQPTPMSDRQLRQRIGYSLAQLRHARTAIDAAEAHVQGTWDAINARIVRDSLAAITPTPEPEPSPELWPDSLSLTPDTLDLRVGEEGEFGVIWWFTIPQEAESGSRPFVCVEGLGLVEVAPGTRDAVDDGHWFAFREGSCADLERGGMTITPVQPSGPGVEA